MRAAHLLTLGLLATPLATGCVSMGTNYDESAVAQLKPGMNKAQVIAMLGKPNTTVTLADGSQHVNWIYSRGTMLGTAKARSLTLIFGPDGKFRQTLTEATTELR